MAPPISTKATALDAFRVEFGEALKNFVSRGAAEGMSAGKLALEMAAFSLEFVADFMLSVNPAFTRERLLEAAGAHFDAALARRREEKKAVS